ncbi:hypothetical protein [Halomonas sp. TD01]|uniref:hypothetical protein n=1 Tax=Halomonas sp. TD01 TaxID=999141 RepID=UPI000214F9C0|nr:hypothetical protein [Halomonas sp. TD01]EGP18630.1 hypothetical protein GME_15615 [Halomonas sp. TD01]CAH1044721.1 hypothetical protein HPTD01_3199 [Halomonas sp. TD01]
MDDYNIKEEKDNNEVNGESKLGGFYSGFFLYGQNKGGFSMGLQKYETRIRKKILNLKEKKKLSNNLNEQKSIEKEVLFLKTRLINNTDNAIYNYLTDRVSKHNVVNMNRVKKTQKAIAEELALDATAVSKSFKKLKELHIIDFTKSGSAFEKIFISPRILWKKDVHIHSKVIYDLNHLGGFDNFRINPFEVDDEYLNPPEKNKAA